MSVRGKGRVPKVSKNKKTAPKFTPPSDRALVSFRKKCNGVLPHCRICGDSKTRRESPCVLWSGAYRIDRLRSNPRMVDGSGNFSPGIPYCGKTSARLIAYYICSDRKVPPASYKGMHCSNAFCVNPWHVIWHDRLRNELAVPRSRKKKAGSSADDS